MQSLQGKDHIHEHRIAFDVLDTEWLFEALEPLPERPVAILDIDSTIMDTAPRNRGILEAARRLFPQIEAVIPTLSDTDLGWGVAATVAERAGLSATEEQRLERFWADRFFSNQWLACDHPYPGVRSFLHDLARRGFHLVYLTGRDKPNMCDGTIASFQRHELPAAEGITFIFKPDAAHDDIAFKQSAIETVMRLGTPILAIDNEPGNANTFRRAFPEAVVLFMDTITSPEPEPLAEGIHVFRRYPVR
jgi:phosphoglycolate phosphatase-like HAD superfamily hydrolase